MLEMLPYVEILRRTKGFGSLSQPNGVEGIQADDQVVKYCYCHQQLIVKYCYHHQQLTSSTHLRIILSLRVHI
jgi:hypothetical protein